MIVSHTFVCSKRQFLQEGFPVATHLRFSRQGFLQGGIAACDVLSLVLHPIVFGRTINDSPA